jgi:hypothetical protein
MLVIHNISDVKKAGGINKYAKKKGLKSISSKISSTIKFTDKEWSATLKAMKED